MELYQLPLDIWTVIGSNDIDIWILLAHCNEHFMTFTRNNIPMFVELFTIKSYCDDDFKCYQWTLFGKIHRVNDLPAQIFNSGVKLWMINNKLHRDGDKPAVTHPFGINWYYKNGSFIHGEII